MEQEPLITSSMIIRNCFDDLPFELVDMIVKYISRSEAKLLFTLSRSLYSMMSSIPTYQRLLTITKKLGTNPYRLLEYSIEGEINSVLYVNDEKVDGIIFRRYKRYYTVFINIKNPGCNMTQKGMLVHNFHIKDYTNIINHQKHTYGKVTNRIHTIKFKGDTSSVKNNFTRQKANYNKSLYFGGSIRPMMKQVNDSIDHMIEYVTGDLVYEKPYPVWISLYR